LIAAGDERRQANMWQVSREAVSRGILGVFAVSLTFSAMQLAFGRDLGGVSQAPLASSEASINRAAKADRAAGRAVSAAPTHTILLRLDSLSDTSILVRVPVAQSARSGASAPSFAKPGDRKVACEPVVSVLTEVAKQLQPGRCIT
jgi:hypothetical protein